LRCYSAFPGKESALLISRYQQGSSHSKNTNSPIIGRPRAEVPSGQLDSTPALGVTKGRSNDTFARHVINDEGLGTEAAKLADNG
jgi:hypothetical protein